MKSVKDKVNSPRREFVKNMAAGAAAAARMGSLSCSESTSPPGEEPQTEPKSSAMTREEFLEYMDCFNRKDFDGVTSYFAPDITVEYYDNATGPQVPAKTLHGPEGFIDNYKALFSTVREVLELGEFMSTEDRVFVELYTEFHTFEDTPVSEGRQGRKKGDIQIMTNWVLYDMVDGKMKRIRIAHWRNHDPATAKYKV
jgi:hypothetical protein